jgi:hypothetical protein
MSKQEFKLCDRRSLFAFGIDRYPGVGLDWTTDRLRPGTLKMTLISV